MNKSLWLAVLLLVFSVNSFANKWVIANHDIPAQPGILLIKGVNNTSQAQRLLIRVDDAFRPNYANRVNLERMIPSGDFTLEVDLMTLHKSNKTPLNIETIKQIIIFTLATESIFTIHSTQFVKPASQNFAGIGWDFGAANSKVWPGFTQITPSAKSLTGRHLHAVVREQHFGINEGLITDGIKGIEKIKLPIGKGTWTLTLFMDDMGDWEYTPHILSQTILLNEMVVKDTQCTHAQWVNTHYLKGKNLQYHQSANVFTDYIDTLYQPLTLTFTTDKDENYLYLRGDTADSQYLSGLIIEPAQTSHLLNDTQQRRQQWWEQNWPIQSTPSQYSTDIVLQTEAPTQLSQAKGSQYFYHLTLPQALSGAIEIASITGTSDHHRLQPVLRQATWKLTRTELKSNLLSPRADHFIAPHSAMHTTALPVRYLLHLTVPQETPAGTYQLNLQLKRAEQEYSFPIAVTVLDVVLPPPNKALGVYLEPPYQHTFSGPLTTQKAASCDIEYLSSLGLTALAPGLSTPSTNAFTADFFAELSALQKAGLTQPIMAYTPFKRMLAAVGIDTTIAKLEQINTTLEQRGYPPVYFSVVDEPSNADAEKLRVALSAHSFKTAGQYNHDKDQSWFAQTDLNLINAGVTLTHDFLAPWVAQGRRFWLYNIEDHYTAASLLSWFLPVEGYLQWHARMPTALPYVPFDGREDDVQFLYPQAQICPNFYHISAGLGALSNGITDHRWLLWLDEQALQQPQAKRLQHNIQQYIQTHLDPTTPFTDDDWLTQIKALASATQE